MKMREIVNSYQSINQLMGTTVKASIGFKLSKIQKKLEDEFNAFQDTRKRILEQDGLNNHLDEKGFLLPDSDMSEEETEVLQERFKVVIKEINSLNEQESDFDHTSIEPIKISDLVTAEGKEVDIQPAVFSLLDWLIVE